MTSAFCWHHTDRADREALRGSDMQTDDTAKVNADRIISVLGDAKIAEIVQHLEANGDITVLLESITPSR